MISVIVKLVKIEDREKKNLPHLWLLVVRKTSHIFLSDQKSYLNSRLTAPFLSSIPRFTTVTVGPKIHDWCTSILDWWRTFGWVLFRVGIIIAILSTTRYDSKIEYHDDCQASGYIKYLTIPLAVDSLYPKRMSRPFLSFLLQRIFSNLEIGTQMKEDCATSSIFEIRVIYFIHSQFVKNTGIRVKYS